MNHIVEKGWKQMSKEKEYKLKDLIIDACDSLEDEWEDIQKGLYDLDDLIHEIADSAIPIYYWDIAQYAAWNTWLMQEIPETNPNGNAHDQIQANIYEAVCEGLHEHIAERDEREAEADQMEMDSESNGYDKKDVAEKEKEDE